MGLNTTSVYLDSCIAIYLVEENLLFAPKLETELANNPTVELFISPLTEMECIVYPIRLQNQPLIEKFENWFTQTNVLPMDRDIFLEAARLRANFPSLKTPDAIHIATALHHGCDEFWTNDNRLNSIVPNLVKNIL